MRLPRPFYRLPVRFDPARLQAELEALPDTAWARHPKEFEGNASIRLISVDGTENDGMRGVMRPTAHLQACPYVRQVLASFGVVWSRSRFMRLECPVKRARARGHELSLVSARASPHSRDHVARSHLQMRRRKRPHGSR